MFVYYLQDPRFKKPRYVGYTKNLEQRYKNHLKPSNLKSNTHKNKWIKSLLRINIKPEIKIIETITSLNYKEREKFWIKHFKKLGYKLTNGTGGGDGVLNPSPETRLKMSITHKNLGTKPPDRSGIFHSDKVKKQMSESHKGINTWMKGRKLSSQTKEKISQSNMGKKMSRNCLIKRSNSRRKVSDKQIKKINFLKHKRHLTNKQISKIMFLSKVTISKILNNKLFYTKTYYPEGVPH